MNEHDSHLQEQYGLSCYVTPENEKFRFGNTGAQWSTKRWHVAAGVEDTCMELCSSAVTGRFAILASCTLMGSLGILIDTATRTVVLLRCNKARVPCLRTRANHLGIPIDGKCLRNYPTDIKVPLDSRDIATFFDLRTASVVRYPAPKPSGSRAPAPSSPGASSLHTFDFLAHPNIHL